METSLLSSLPAEIRNSIYAYALFEPNGVYINSEPALLATCKQIRGEASLMYWAVNQFHANIREQSSNRSFCRWLKKADPRLCLIESLVIHIDMPSIGPEAVPDDGPSEKSPCGFVNLMHIVDMLRQANWRRPHIENVISFRLNGACDSETFESIDAMSEDLQDHFRGSKFFLLCLVHGSYETALALESVDYCDTLGEKDDQIQKGRSAHARSRLLSASIS
ncbi:uncharacterized protein RCC_07737 [Ramularia collo-cygni]|uniref:Uncharacterized protein n=1 Tax=Ramularia collo-cygni TaxID=112498 RepID=A0A2D3UYA0_9PEZI|nr:uncharacterized protein RCC_07737 [Ramularia collo-cygni]CZT21871.1 uncharacterized protein RCC_07737 [Ramularia collo-cygni]